MTDLDLLADRALSGEGEHPIDRDEERVLRELELAVAAVALAGVAQEEMPADVAERVFSSFREETLDPAREPLPEPHAHAPAPDLDVPRWVPWVAAAGCLIVAAFAWLRPVGVREVRVEVPVAVPAQPPPERSMSEERARLLADPSTVTLPFAATKDQASQGASGDVVWNQAQQRGFMRIASLAKNDPGAIQYQLWIFDAERDDKYPVDGGVFDVSSGEVIVPIRSKLAVRRPALFAITVEKPGGVVVSKRERIVLVAKPG